MFGKMSPVLETIFSSLSEVFQRDHQSKTDKFEVANHSVVAMCETHTFSVWNIIADPRTTNESTDISKVTLAVQEQDERNPKKDAHYAGGAPRKHLLSGEVGRGENTSEEALRWAGRQVNVHQ